MGAIDPALWERCAPFAEGRLASAYLYCRGGVNHVARFHSRMFAPDMGIAEDPATGAAVAAMSGAIHFFDKLVDGLNNAARLQLATLTQKEFAAAAKCEFPHLYGTPPEQRYTAWGSGTEIGLTRARSDNLPVRIRGIALWLTVAYHETRGTTLPALDGVHRSLLRSLRQLRETLPATTSASWFSSEQAA